MGMPEDDPPAGVPEWVVTYGDMMSLLLTFFIMLVSMSEMKDDSGDLRAALDALQERFGMTPEMISGIPGTSLQEESMFSAIVSQGTRREGGLKKSGRDAPGALGAHEGVRRLSHGQQTTLGGNAEFERFSATPTASYESDLAQIAETLKGKANRVMVRGHASPEPLPQGHAFADPYELSFARAEAVAARLVELGIREERLIVSAAGDSEPKIVTRDPDEQAANRRVDVFLTDLYIPSP